MADSIVYHQNFYGTDKYYQRIDTSATWVEAQAHAESLGGNLVSMHSEEELDFLYDTFYTSTTPNKVWIGLYKEYPSNDVQDLRWVDGSSPDWIIYNRFTRLIVLDDESDTVFRWDWGIDDSFKNDQSDQFGRPYLISWASEPFTPVPEPTTMLLFGTGLIGLVGIRRKQSKK